MLTGNSLTKVFPDGGLVVTACNQALWSQPGFKCPRFDKSSGRTLESLKELEDRGVDMDKRSLIASLVSLLDYRRRHIESARVIRSKVRTAIYDRSYAGIASGVFKWFVTLTLDEKLCSRSDWPEIVKRLSKWLSNRQQSRGMQYLLVPEYHADGVNIHFHGLIDASLKVEWQGHFDDNDPNRKVFNVIDWPYGVVTRAVEVYGSPGACACYMTKYITKASDKIGGRWYLSSVKQNLPDRYVDTVDYKRFKEVLGYFNIDSPFMADAELSRYTLTPDGTVL